MEEKESLNSQDQFNSQMDELILMELEKLNSHLEILENIEKARDEEALAKKVAEEERIANGELNSEDKILEELKNVTVSIQSLKEPTETDNKILSDFEVVIKNLEKGQEERLSEKNINKLVTSIQKDYENMEMSSKVVNSYGLLFVPVAVVLYIIYSLLKDFI